MHDRMDAAEVRVMARSQPWKCKAAVWQDDPGIECACVPILQAAQVSDCVFGGCGVVPSDGSAAGYGG